MNHRTTMNVSTSNNDSNDDNNIRIRISRKKRQFSKDNNVGEQQQQQQHKKQKTIHLVLDDEDDDNATIDIVIDTEDTIVTNDHHHHHRHMDNIPAVYPSVVTVPRSDPVSNLAVAVASTVSEQEQHKQQQQQRFEKLSFAYMKQHFPEGLCRALKHMFARYALCISDADAKDKMNNTVFIDGVDTPMMRLSEISSEYHIESEFIIVPVLDLKSCADYREYHDYIEFVNPNDLSYPIMTGIDCYRRRFFAFNTTFRPNDYSRLHGLVPGSSVCFVFQRYTPYISHSLSSFPCSSKSSKPFFEPEQLWVFGGSDSLCDCKNNNNNYSFRHLAKKIDYENLYDTSSVKINDWSFLYDIVSDRFPYITLSSSSSSY